MNIARYVLIVLFFVLSVAGRMASAAGTADSMTDQEIVQRFQLMEPQQCKRVGQKMEPPGHPDSVAYDERFYLDLDGDGTCEILDVWVDRVTPDPDDYRLDGMSAIYKYQKKHWIKEETDLPCRPKYQIFDRKNKTIYYLVDFDGDLYKPVDGIYHLIGGLQLRPLYKGGIWLCSVSNVCKGVDFKHVAEVLLKKKEPAEINKAEPNK